MTDGTTAKSNRKILLVDDEAAVRNLYRIFLEKHGLVVFTAGGVREALQALHDLEFDVAVVDLRLGDGDGMDVVRRVRRGPAPRAVAMTGHARNDAAAEELRSAGVAVYDKLEPISELVRLISMA